MLRATAAILFVSLISVGVLPAATPAYIIQTIAGTGNAADGGPATSAVLIQAEGIAIDSGGNIYVSDAGDNRVRKISPNGTIATIAGTGVAGLSGDGGPATACELNHPYGLAADLWGNIYIADLGNGRVRKIDRNGIVQTVASSPLKSPRNLAADAFGNLYISDFEGQRIYRLAVGGDMAVVAGTGVAGSTSDGSAASAQFNYPAGLALDTAGNLYVADTGNGVVRRISGGAITTVAAKLSSPTGLALDASGHLYVSSPGATAPTHISNTVEILGGEDVAVDAASSVYLLSQHFVQKAAGTAAITTAITIAGSAAYANSGDNGPAAAARLMAPAAIAADSAGNIYIAEQGANRIRQVAPDRTIKTLSDATAGWKMPSGIAVDGSGTVYVADTGNNRIRRITAGGVVSTFAANVSSPTAIRVAKDGSLYVCETGNDDVLKLTPAGVKSVVAKASQPAGVAIAADGTLAVATGGQILRAAIDGTVTTLLDGLSNPAGLAYDSTGNLWIAETGKQRVIAVATGGAVNVLAGASMAGFTGDNGPALSAELNGPTDIAFDNFGNAFVADTMNNRIRELVPQSGVAPGALTSAPPLAI